ncbi:lysophospholipid acyltransferase family protein [Cystobacter fuscus]
MSNALLSTFAWLETDLVLLMGFCIQALLSVLSWPFDKRKVVVGCAPEGTRSKNDELLTFKDGAFRLAIEAGADVLPLAMSGTRRALTTHSWRFATARSLLTMGTPISTQGMTLADLERRKVRRASSSPHCARSSGRSPAPASPRGRVPQARRAALRSS